MKIIVTDAPEPIQSEFKNIVDTQAIGMPIGEACTKLYERMPLAEANFFGIVISIQQKAGGNLSEALGNLSRVLRDRKKMKAKIRAMSMEAKASAGIIGALPDCRGRRRLYDQSRLHFHSVRASNRAHHARRQRGLDDARHLHYEKDDQFRLLRRENARGFAHSSCAIRSFSRCCSLRSRSGRRLSRLPCRCWEVTLYQAHERRRQ